MVLSYYLIMPTPVEKQELTVRVKIVVRLGSFILQELAIQK